MACRSFLAAACLVATTEVASAKLLVCPQGRFAVTALAGAVLRLGDGGMVELEGRCAPAAARGRRAGA